LFLARFGYELVRPESASVGLFGGYQENMIAQGEFGVSASRKNYASAKIVVTQADSAQTVEQKYERISTIDTKTSAWDDDVKTLESAIAAVGGMVQRENSYGLSGARVLSLSLGVVPDIFGDAVERLKSIGDLASINTVKQDRTGDFRALEAKRLSLEKTRDGLAALRSAGAALADRIELETRILEIEGQIQELGVGLGDFSETNSFCTIEFTLREIASRPLPARLAKAAFAALEWSAAVFFGLALAALCVSGTAWFGVKLRDRFFAAKKE
jgi:hypothetical protein